MDTSKSYALKFISGKYQGGEFPLKADKQVVIGRSSELDMVLVEDMVSRKHAKIVFSDGKITIEDLGSTNGTFVNGEKVKQARLKEGDRILIGTSILKLVHQGADGANVDESMAKQKLEEAAAAQAARTTNKASSMTGKIEEIPLPDLLQLFHTSKKNGVLVVMGDQEGKIYLRQGRVYYAVIGENHNLGPQKSFNRIITWEKGDFELRPADNQEFMVELDSSTEALLMDALRQLDEFKRLQPSLPPLDAPLALASPLTPPLKELSPELLDVLQLIHNHGSLGGVLDRADADDVVTAEAVVQLLKRDYVRQS
ncbi:FHA domain-containing protein [Myxococcus sp. RHSTA-1-4]|uniref:FHA domain-containing protein n=1 Tax=Myxococcus sp. RHSTA-1-4 TaxID=2874601 RepID=UPI001CBC47B2|nr:FHA domain-containing protein [Myxococcus sp. RHSTA-1-4]MBZ4418223.1 FHA domain-containing protein [Myxococcus sp. RHSTA-1-4]